MLNNLLKIVILLFIPWTVSSCRTDSQPWADEEDTEVNVYFRLSVDGAVSQLSRGSWNDNLDTPSSNDYPAEIGSSYDTKIQTSSVVIHVYDASSSAFVGRVEDLMCFPMNNQSNEYQFVGKIPKDKLKTGTSYKFMVFANTQTVLPNDVTLDKVSYNVESVQLDDANFIPMWGVQTISLAADANNELQPKYDIGDIYLLRAVAKVQVGLTSEVANQYSLTKATINFTNPTGYILPKSWNQVSSTTEISHESELPSQSFNPLTSTTPAARDFKDEIVGVQKVIYLPEYENSAEKEAAISIEVMDKSSKQRLNFTDKIKFRTYQNGQVDMTSSLFNIVRNYEYQFEIRKVVSGNSLDLTCKVNPWNVHEENLEYDDQVSVSNQIKWDITTCTVDEQQVEVILKSGHKPTCTFTIDTPKGAHWRASFIPMEGNRDAFRFYTAAHPEGVSEMVGELGKQATLVIIPTDYNNDITNKALLKIVVDRADGTTLLAPSLLPVGAMDKEGYTIIQSK